MSFEKRYQLGQEEAAPKFIIYAIMEPDVQEIVYVGRSSSGFRRPKAHFNNSSLKRKSPLSNWIKKQIALGQKPIITVLDQAKKNSDELNVLERYHISMAKLEGDRLKNLTEGGGGILGYKRSEESKQKMSAKYKGIRPSDLCMQMNKLTKTGRKLSAEQRLILRETSWKSKKIICLSNKKIYSSARHAQEDFKDMIKCHKSILHSAKHQVPVKGIQFRYAESL